MRRESLSLITESGMEVFFDDRATKLILERTSFGMPPVEFRTRRAPYQDGETPLSFRLRPRVINLKLGLFACSRAELYQLRREIIQANNPNVAPMKLKWVAPDGKPYYLNVYYHGGIGFPTSGQPTPLVQNEGIQLIAYDPYWYDWNESSVDYSFVFSADDREFYFSYQPDDTYVYVSDAPIFDFPLSFPVTDAGYTLAGPEMSFPITFGLSESAGSASMVFTKPVKMPKPDDWGELHFPIVFGGSTSIDHTFSLINRGDVEVYLDIYFYGKWYWPRIENLDSGESFYWDDIISSNSTLHIDGENRLVYLNDTRYQKPYGSDWIRLLPSWEVSGGINRIKITGRQRKGSIGLKIIWRNKYLGF